MFELLLTLLEQGYPPHRRFVLIIIAALARLVTPTAEQLPRLHSTISKLLHGDLWPVAAKALETLSSPPSLHSRAASDDRKPACAEFPFASRSLDDAHARDLVMLFAGAIGRVIPDNTPLPMVRPVLNIPADVTAAAHRPPSSIKVPTESLASGMKADVLGNSSSVSLANADARGSSVVEWDSDVSADILDESTFFGEFDFLDTELAANGADVDNHREYSNVTLADGVPVVTVTPFHREKPVSGDVGQAGESVSHQSPNGSGLTASNAGMGVHSVPVTPLNERRTSDDLRSSTSTPQAGRRPEGDTSDSVPSASSSGRGTPTNGAASGSETVRFASGTVQDHDVSGMEAAAREVMGGAGTAPLTRVKSSPSGASNVLGVEDEGGPPNLELADSVSLVGMKMEPSHPVRERVPPQRMSSTFSTHTQVEVLDAAPLLLPPRDQSRSNSASPIGERRPSLIGTCVMRLSFEEDHAVDSIDSMTLVRMYGDLLLEAQHQLEAQHAGREAGRSDPWMLSLHTCGRALELLRRGIATLSGRTGRAEALVTLMGQLTIPDLICRPATTHDQHHGGGTVGRVSSIHSAEHHLQDCMKALRGARDWLNRVEHDVSHSSGGSGGTFGALALQHLCQTVDALLRAMEAWMSALDVLHSPALVLSGSEEAGGSKCSVATEGGLRLRTALRHAYDGLHQYRVSLGDS
jgi:hypothetical protein